MIEEKAGVDRKSTLRNGRKKVDRSETSPSTSKGEKSSGFKSKRTNSEKRMSSGSQPTILSMFSKAGNSSSAANNKNASLGDVEKSSNNNNNIFQNHDALGCCNNHLSNRMNVSSCQRSALCNLSPSSNNNSPVFVKEEPAEAEEGDLALKRKSEALKELDFQLDYKLDLSEPIEKRIKREKDGSTEVENTSAPLPMAVKVKRCEICRQVLDEGFVGYYAGHPKDAVEEFIALTDPKLSLFGDDEGSMNEADDRPQNKLTGFSIYDKEGHLCSLDSGLIERNVLLFISGYMKPIYEENPDPEDGVPAMDIGPINEWWVAGFDGGEAALLGVSTAYADYFFMEPSEEYVPYMKPMWEKIFMSKLVIEFLLSEMDPVYEDLLSKLQTTVPPGGIGNLTEESLLQHSQFICDQVQSFDGAALDTDLLITTPCMRTLMKLSGITLGKRRAMRRSTSKSCVNRKLRWTKATTTALVRNVFETFFPEQIEESDSVFEAARRRRCGVCEVCQMPDCGACTNCKQMVKFGGSGRSKQACAERRCPNLAVQAADESDAEEDADIEKELPDQNKNWLLKTPGLDSVVEQGSADIGWIGKPNISSDLRKYYSRVSVNGMEFGTEDCVLVKPKDPNAPFLVAKVINMWEDDVGCQKLHVWWFQRGCDTVLGETSDPQEVFLTNACEEISFGLVATVATVQFCGTPADWGNLVGESLATHELPNDGKSFFYQKAYDAIRGRFEDITVKFSSSHDIEDHPGFCECCEQKRLFDEKNTPSVSEPLEEVVSSHKEVNYRVAYFKGEEYRVGHGVYLNPDTFKFRTFKPRTKTEKIGKVIDETMYPEYYRKSSDYLKGSNDETCEPFCIGYISAIAKKTSGDIVLHLHKLYRPENTHRGSVYGQQLDLNLLFWSDEEYIANMSEVLGKCHIVFSENIDEMESVWSSQGPDRFYFRESYDSKNQTFGEPSSKGMHVGLKGKGKGKGKGKSASSAKADPTPPGWPKVSRQLRCLDVFAGCGGLSEGLHQADIARTKWAVEIDESAANAFRLNSPETTVFSEDCNEVLKLVLKGDKVNGKGQLLPQRGEVDILCGGPPCQGFSGMNRFNSRQYSLFKNSLVVSFLSYCDYYRPRYFVLENVRNFVSFKRSIVLKLTLRCLIKMGYQCCFGILQAGHYGVPQTRRRAIILAAAPGEVLPEYPSALHVFSKRISQLAVVVDNKKFCPLRGQMDVAPLRTITVRDAMSDLPEIFNGHNKDEMSYGGEPMSQFQRQIRGNQYVPILRDHVCKRMAPLIQARMANIPTAPGSDWRDLPNIAVRLSDGKMTSKLLYLHHDKKNGKASNSALRGVCPCAEGKPCDPVSRQFNTLIPWCLPHTGNRHNNWAGLYGRLEWDGFFSTTVTNPEPMGKQGRVLHPEQTRVVSVRECARSQGFPDTYRFFGSILERHRQIGNAVPPPMARWIGIEIRKSLAAKDERDSEEASF